MCTSVISLCSSQFICSLLLVEYVFSLCTTFHFVLVWLTELTEVLSSPFSWIVQLGFTSYLAPTLIVGFLRADWYLMSICQPHCRQPWDPLHLHFPCFFNYYYWIGLKYFLRVLVATTWLLKNFAHCMTDILVKHLNFHFHQIWLQINPPRLSGVCMCQ